MTRTTTAPQLPTRDQQARLLNAYTVRPFITGIRAHATGWHCYLSPPCPLWMGCDCPPHQYLSDRPQPRRW
jgi:hypothetical protein